MQRKEKLKKAAMGYPFQGVIPIKAMKRRRGLRLSLIHIFVMIIMIIASSRPIFKLAESVVNYGAKLGKSSPGAWWISGS